jgi:DNA-3-methyladenine glycosylase II
MKTLSGIEKNNQANGVYQWLADRDDLLSNILSQYGEPELILRPEGFRTLVFIVIEQQISLQAARKIFERLESRLKKVNPETVFNTSAEIMKTIGLNRQKINTLHELSRRVISREIDLNQLQFMDDEDVRKVLVSIKGIGNWTADIYLLEALNRPDILPSTDLALARCIQEIWGLEKRPDREIIVKMALRWRPWRSYAVRLIWTAYLNGQHPV